MEAIKEKIFFFNSHGEKLSGIITYPKDSNHRGPLPSILLCQGLSGVKNLVMPIVADAFAKEGWISLAFDYSGFGESEGEKGWIDPFKRIKDAVCAWTYLASDPLVDKNNIAVYGLSYGGPVAICLLSRIPTLKAAVAVSAPGNGRSLMRQMRNESQWEEFIRQVDEARKKGISTGKWQKTDIFLLFPFSKNFMEKYSKLGNHPQSSAVNSQDQKNQGGFFLNSADCIMALHPELDVRKKGAIPLLLVSGANDDVATPEQVKEIANNAPEVTELHFLPGMDHVDLDTGMGLKIQIEMAAEWFRKYFN